MELYQIKNWTKFQRHKDRRPPWIRIYRRLLEDADFHQLGYRERYILVGLWLVASDDDTCTGTLTPIHKIAFILRESEDDIRQALKALGHWVSTSCVQDGCKMGAEWVQDVLSVQVSTEQSSTEQNRTESQVPAEPPAILKSISNPTLKSRQLTKGVVVKDIGMWGKFEPEEVNRICRIDKQLSLSSGGDFKLVALLMRRYKSKRFAYPDVILRICEQMPKYLPNVRNPYAYINSAIDNAEKRAMLDLKLAEHERIKSEMAPVLNDLISGVLSRIGVV